MDTTKDLLSSDFLEIDDSSADNLKGAGIWARAIGGIVIAASVIIIAWITFLGGRFRSFDSVFFPNTTYLIIVVAILLAVVGFYIIMLFRFHRGITDGINNKDTLAFEKGIDSLKILFLVSGILSFLYLLSNLISILSSL